MSKQIQEATSSAMLLEKAMKRATNTNGEISYNGLQFQLNKANTTAAKMMSTLATGGKQFNESLNAANAALALSNRQSITLGKQMKEIWRVTTQSFKFTAAQTFLRAVSSEAQQAIRWVKDLNEAVNNIAVVTGKSGDEITRVTEQAIRGSRQLKIAAKDYAEGALIFYQQGLNDEEVTRRNEITIKASLAANQSISEMSKQLTAIWNTYGMVGEQQQRAAAVGAALAARTAVDFKDIAEAMQSAAAPAAQMGVEYNQLAAIIATVGDTTQQSASTIGNAYKTIFARFQQLKAEGTDGEVTLSSVSKQLENMGVKVLDAKGNLRELGIVINEVGSNWENWSRTQQTAIAQIVGGTRQYGQFLALMDNFDKYQKNLNTANLETGSTLESQYTQALDSIEHKAEMSAEAWKRAFSEIIPEDALKTFYDALTKTADMVGIILRGFGGLPGILTLVGVNLSGKIIPALITAKKNVSTITQNLTHNGRVTGIRQDYADQRKENDKKLQDSSLSPDSRAALQMQQEKLKLNEQIALENERINTAMRTATEQQKIQLQNEQQQLANIERINAKSIERQGAIAQELAGMKQITSEMTQQLELERAGLAGSIVADKEEAGVVQSRINALQGRNDEQANAQKIRLNERLAEINDRIIEQQIRMEALNNAISKSKTYSEKTKELMGFYRQLNATRAGLEQTTESEDQMRERLSKYSQELEKMLLSAKEEFGLTEDQIQEMTKSLSAENFKTDGLDELLDRLHSILESTGLSTEALRRLAAESADAGGDRGRNNNNFNRISGNTQGGSPGGNPNGDDDAPQKVDYSKIAGGIVQIGSAAAGTTMALTSMFNTIQNGDYSSLQGIATVGAQLLMQLPMLASSATAAGTGLVSMAAAAGVAAAAEEKATFASVFLGASAKEAWLSVLGSIALVVVAIAGVIAIIMAVKSAFDSVSAQHAFEEAKASAEGLKEAEEAAKAEADNLRASLENYDTAVNKLNECTKGTQEWRDAMKEANKAALEVINSLNGLSAEEIRALYNRDKETGQITLNREKMNEIQAQKDAQASTAEMASQIGQLNMQAAQRRMNITNLVADNRSMLGAVAGGAAVGGIEGSMLATGVGTAIGAAVGGLTGAFIKSVDDQNIGKRISENLDQLMGLGDKEFQKKLAELGLNVDITDNAFKSIKSQIEQMGEAAEAASAQMELIALMQADEILGDNYGEAEKTIAAKNIESHSKEIEDELYRAFTEDISRFTGNGNSTVTDMLARLNKAQGTSWAMDANGVRGGKNERQFVFTDESGEEHKLSARQVAATIAASEALEQLKVDAETAAGMLDTLTENAGEEISTGLQNYLSTGNLESMNQKDFETLQAEIDGYEGGAAEYLQQMFDMTDEELTAILGDDYGSKLEEAVKNYGVAFDNFKNGLYDVVQKGYDSLDADKENLNVEGQKAMARAMQDAFINSGREGLENVQEVFDALDADNIQDFTDLVSGIDWTQTGVEEFTQALKDAGIETDLTAEQLANFAKAMSNEDLSTEFTKLTDSYSELHKIIDGLEVGDTISAEDYEKLSDPMKEYFTLMEDGTYSLVKSASELKGLLSGTEQRERLGNISKLKDDINQTTQRSEQGQNLVDKYGTDSALNEESWTYDEGTVRGQLDLLTLYQDQLGLSDEKLQQWYADLDDGSGYFENGAAGLAEIAKYAQQAAESIEEDSTALETNKELMQSMQEAYLATATSVYELDNLYGQLKEEMGEMGASANAYNEALISMASQYDNTGDEIKKMQEAMASVEFDSNGNITKESEAMVEAAQNALKAATLIGEGAKKYNLDARVLETQAKALSKAYKLDEESAARLAIANQRMNKGISTLNSNFKGWKETLKSTEKTSQDYADAVVGITDAVADLVGAADGFELPEGFLDSEKNLQLLEQAANGSESAINQLGNMMAQNQISLMEYNQALVDSAIAEGKLGENFNAEKFEGYKTTVLEGLEALKGKIGELEDGADVGDLLGENWVDSLNQMAIATGMSVEEMNGLLNEMGVQAEVTTTSVPQTMDVPTYDEVVEPTTVTVTNTDSEGNKTQETRHAWKHYTVPGEPKTVEGYVQVAQIKSEGNDGVSSSPKLTWTGTSGRSAAGHSPKASTGKPSSSTDKNGGGGDKSKVSSESKTKKDDITERYLNIESAINDNTRALERFNNAADDAWGAKKLKNMAIATQLLQRQANYYSRLAKEAANYMPQDLAAIGVNEGVTNAAYNLKTQFGKNADFAGIAAQFQNMLTFNPDKTIANMEQVRQYGQSILDQYWQLYQSGLQNYNAMYAGADESDASKAAKEELDKVKGIYELWKEFIDGEIEAVEKYDETANKAYDALQNAVQSIRDWMTSKVDRLKAQMEIILKPDQRDLSRLERIAGQFGDAARQLGYATELNLKQIENLMHQNSDLTLGIERANQMSENITNGMAPKDTPKELQNWFQKTFGAEAWEEYINGNGGLPEQIGEYLTDARDQLEENLYSITDLAMDELDNVYAGIEDWFNNFTNMIDHQLEKTNATLEFYQTVSDWIDPDKITGSQQAIQRSLNYAKMESTKTAAIGEVGKANAAQKAMKKASDELQEAQDKYAAAENDQQRQFWAGVISRHKQAYDQYKEEFESYETSAIEGVTELFSTAQEVLDSQKQMTRNALAASLESLFVTVDQIGEVYDSIKNYQDMYLDDYDKKYELGTLQRTFDRDIEDMDIDIANYEGLVEWQEKLNKYKEEGVNLTTEELSVLQAEYEYQMAMAKLEQEEEARKNNKNTMRLSRDASGNYSYVYSGDTSSGQNEDLAQKAADAEKKYRDAINDAQEAFQDASMETYQALIDHLDNFSEELYERSPEYRKWYDSQLDMLLEEYDAATNSTNQMFEIMGESADKLRIQYEDTAMGVMTQTTNMDDAHEKWRDALVGPGYQVGGGMPGGYYGAIIQAETEMASTLQAAADKIGEADGGGILGGLNLQFGLTKEHTVGELTEIQGGIKTTTNTAAEETTTLGNILRGEYHDNWNDATQDTLDHIGGPESQEGDGTIIGGLLDIVAHVRDMTDDTGTSLDTQLGYIDSWKDTFVSRFEEAERSVRALIQAIDDLENKQAEQARQALKKENDTNGQDDGLTTPQDLPDTSPAINGPPYSPPAPSSSEVDVNSGYAIGKYKDYTFTGVSPNRKYYLGPGYNNQVTGEDARTIQDLINVGIGSSQKKASWTIYKRSSSESEKRLIEKGILPPKEAYTGGLFTEPDVTKIAEKGPELVLNKEDTENILKAVSLMRQTVAAQFGSINGSLAGVTNSITHQAAPPVASTQPVDQQVHIEASFPGVSVAQEIEDALNSLITQAAQYNIKR